MVIGFQFTVNGLKLKIQYCKPVTVNWITAFLIIVKHNNDYNQPRKYKRYF